MTKLKITLIIASVAISLAVTLILHRTAQVKSRDNDAALHRQDEQLSELIAEQQRLSNQVAEARSSTNSQLSELAKLRNQAQTLQKQTNELQTGLKSNRQARASQPASKPESHPPEYYDQLHRAAAAKPLDARNLIMGFLMYASDHQGRFPSSLDQVATYLRKEEMPLSGTNQFDIVYHGSLADLKGIPRGGVAVIRDRQTWIAPSGKQARVYGMANGSSLIVESDDDFKAWEAENIISSVPAGQ
jgi:chorismate mutase